MATPTLTNLPNELIFEIFKYLRPPLDFDHLQDDPEYTYRRCQPAFKSPLKNASLVCRRWRANSLPLLYRHIIWSFARCCEPEEGADAQIDFVGFLKRNGLSRYVDTLTIFINTPEGLGSRNYEQGKWWGVLPPASYLRRLRLPKGGFNNWFWGTIFNQIDPLRITVVGPQWLLAKSICPIDRGDLRDSPSARLEIISLSREGRSADFPSLQPHGVLPLPQGLCGIRPWTSLLANNGIMVPESGVRVPTILCGPFADQLYDTIPFFSLVVADCGAWAFTNMLRCIPQVRYLHIQRLPQIPEGEVTLGKGNESWNVPGERQAFLICRCFASLVNKGYFSGLKQLEIGDVPNQKIWDKLVRRYLQPLAEDWDFHERGIITRKKDPCVKIPVHIQGR